MTTVEGVGSVRAGLHPVQRQLAESHGSQARRSPAAASAPLSRPLQCGFCTPGFVMSCYALLRSSAGKPSEAELEEALSGNLCRCTGYRPILEGLKAFTASRGEGADGSSAHAREARRAAGELAPPPSASSSSVPICPSTGLPCANGCGGGGVEPPPAEASAVCEGCACCEALQSPHPLTGAREPIFPPELRRRVALPLTLPGEVATWHRPTTLPALLRLLRAHPTARLVCGNTEVGIESKLRGPSAFPHLLAPTHVPELCALSTSPADGSLSIGASVSLTRLEEALTAALGGAEAAAAPAGVPPELRGWAAMRRQLRWFAGRQVRNAASVGGNVCTGSPISDLNPLWVALGATFVLAAAGEADGEIAQRSIRAADFFLGYRKTELRPGELLLRVELPRLSAGGLEFAHEFKQSHRREDDIALVNAGFRVRIGDDGVVAEAALAFGGMAARTQLAVRTAEALVGRAWTRETFERAREALALDFPMDEKTPGGMPEFRSALAASFLFKFWVGVAQELAARPDALPGYQCEVRPEEASASACGLAGGEVAAAASHAAPPPRGLQYWTRNPNSEAPQPVGAPLMHCGAEVQATGEAQYVDDVPMPPDTCHAVRLLSDRPHALLLGIDATEALAQPGVVGFYTSADVPGQNAVGPVLQDEFLFLPVGETVLCTGITLGLLVATSEAVARSALRLVKVSYGPDLPALLSIDAARAAGSFLSHPRLTGHALARGDVGKAMAEAEADPERFAIIQGECRCGGQEHFYMETHGSLVWPTEDGRGMEMVSSTQGPTDNAHMVSRVLALPHNAVHCSVRRIGGGFGGKESRAALVAGMAAVAAHALRRPVRLVYDRGEDMASTGGRHPFLGLYRAAVERRTGLIHAAEIEMFANGGCSMDLSHSVLDRAIFHADGGYAIPHLRVSGSVCRTNLPSNTAFRGFGGPQGAFVAESLLDHAARELRMVPEQLRQSNLYSEEGAPTHFGQRLEGNRLGAVWRGALCGEALPGADDGCEGAGAPALVARRAAVAAFNAQHAHRKRGLSCVPTKFGIAFTAKFLNQGGALVHVYSDGTVLLTHGGVEMGQGVHTKMVSVCSAALGVPPSSVLVGDTDTRKVANTSPSAASASADLYGSAVLDACTQILARLAPVRARMGGDGAVWKEVVNAAYFDRIDLSAHGFFATGGLEWDWGKPGPAGGPGTPEGTPFNYFCYGAALCEVELDTLSGDLRVLRCDLVMDVGDSLNPAIDVGQVEGGFIQGMGWLLTEEVKWADPAHAWAMPPAGRPGGGRCLTTGPGTYKIPTANDCPLDFRVALLRGASNPRAVFSSKAVGEPPFMLSLSAFFAAKEAVAAAREDKGPFQLDAPATPERLRLAVGDAIGRAANPAGERGRLSC